MKFLIISILLIPQIFFCQEFQSFKLLSKKDSTAIKDAFIVVDNKVLTISDSIGEFRISKSKVFNLLSVSHLQYEDFSITQEDIKKLKFIFLNERNEVLDEIVISNKKIKTKRVLPYQSALSRIGFYKGHKTRFNTVYATYIPNKYFEYNTVIKNILIEPHPGYWGDSKKQFMSFKVNLYSVDNKTELPLEKILPDIFLKARKNKDQQFVVVNIEDYVIDFPKEGLFISVETLSEQEYLDIQSVSYEPPAFKIIKRDKKKDYITYSRWLSKDGSIVKDWKHPLTELSFVYNFGIEVEFLKNTHH